MKRCLRFNEKLETWEGTCGWVTDQVVRCIDPQFLDAWRQSPVWQLAETNSFFELLGAIEENVQAREAAAGTNKSSALSSASTSAGRDARDRTRGAGSKTSAQSVGGKTSATSAGNENSAEGTGI